MRSTLLALLALLLLAPLASAHVESFSQARTLTAGPYLVYLEPQPTPPFAGDLVTFSVLLSRASDGGIETDVPAALVVTSPAGQEERLEMQGDGRGYLLASTTPTTHGMYAVQVIVTDPATNQTHATDTEIEVFRDLPFRIRAVDAAQDATTGRIVPMAFEVVDPVTLARKDAFQDVSVRVEHWATDHSQMLSYEEVEPTHAGVGLWRMEYRFPEAGMYHIRFASEEAGFTYDDVPLLHLYATDPPPDDERNETPVPVALVLLAFGIVALAARRRRRE